LRQNDSLTTTIAAMIRYEHPLNERIRTLMRLEDLFARARHFAQQEGALEHHAALLAMFEITDVAGRADLKTDLLQELERQKQMLSPLRSNPQIETQTLDELLGEIDGVNGQLLGQAGKVGAHLRENEWLMAIKQRTAIPGGVCEFDLPAYHYWLHRIPARGAATSRDGSNRSIPCERGSRSCCACSATTDASAAHRLSRCVPADADDDQGGATASAHRRARPACVPEISANKYALNIRFLGVSGMDRGSVFDRDVEFELMFCNL
jgi:cell division protein ZapD